MCSDTLQLAEWRPVRTAAEPAPGLQAVEHGVCALPAVDDATLAKLGVVQAALLNGEHVPIQTDHVLHAGMYARTITMPPGVVLVGALVKVPTMVSTVGEGRVYTGEWNDVKGYKVLPAHAHRKQIFVSISPLVITMVFPTSAKTVEEAEKEFTDEHELLLSHRQDCNSVVITGE